MQATLEKNILDNFLIDNVEFVVLDYNSQDGLSDWIHDYMGKYIKMGILVYYKTIEPIHYLRSHSRNMAFLLAKGDIVCNLDADNYLGKGFAQFMLEAFYNEQHIFYTSDLHSGDAFGRVCLTKEDFISVRGYNESLIGYGVEDAELFNRLINKGLKQKIFNQPEFYNVITHSDEDRISHEPQFIGLHKVFLNYINPYTTRILLLYKCHRCESGIIVNNIELNYNLLNRTKGVMYSMDEREKVIIKGNWEKGEWKDTKQNIILTFNDGRILLNKGDKGLYTKRKIYYEIVNPTLIVTIILVVTSALNFMKAQKAIRDNESINPNGFGKGNVYKNFDFNNLIQL